MSRAIKLWEILGGRILHTMPHRAYFALSTRSLARDHSKDSVETQPRARNGLDLEKDSLPANLTVEEADDADDASRVSTD